MRRLRPLAGSPVPANSTSSANRWDRGAWLFRDRTLLALEILLDEAFRIPGTRFRFGIDGVIGLIPGLGDVIAGILSLVIPVAAWIRGVPYITILRMALNLGIGVLVGSIPLFGDIFDVAWKSNRKNYRLLQLHVLQPRKHTWRDWAFLIFLACLIVMLFAMPIVLALWLTSYLLHHFSLLHRG